MKKFLILSLCCFLALTLLSCGNGNPAVDELGQAEEVEVAPFTQEDFVLRIDTLPYRGAVLFIDYNGEMDITEYQVRVDIEVAGDVRQRDMWGEEEDNFLIAEIVDLMYLPGDQLDFTLKIKDDDGEKVRHIYSLNFERYYPWTDWMLAADEWFDVNYHPNFVYDLPYHPNGLGGHASWDIWTTQNKAVKVHCGTVGIVNRIPPACIEGNLEIYNPYVGAIVQYGHTTPADNIHIGKDVVAGEHVANVIPRDKHIHYSVIRPYRYVLKNSSDGYPHYMPIIDNKGAFGDGRFIYHDSYNDPFYFHEPTTLGYWNEETLPPGLKEEMISLFKKGNPDVVLPATKPLNAD